MGSVGRKRLDDPHTMVMSFCSLPKSTLCLTPREANMSGALRAGAPHRGNKAEIQRQKKAGKEATLHSLG